MYKCGPNCLSMVCHQPISPINFNGWANMICQFENVIFKECKNVDQIDFPRFANNLFLQSPGVSAAGPLKRTICISAYLPYTWITSVWLNQNWGLQTQVRANKIDDFSQLFLEKKIGCQSSKSSSYKKIKLPVHSHNVTKSYCFCYFYHHYLSVAPVLRARQMVW